MRAVTIRLSEDKHLRLKTLSKKLGTSVNRLISEMAAMLLAESDAEGRFKLRADRGLGNAARGVQLLCKTKGGSRP